MGIRDDSLRPVSARWPVPARLPRGNHPTSVFYAIPMIWDDELEMFVPALFAQGTPINFLFFTQDHPITVEVESLYHTADTPFLFTDKDFSEHVEAQANAAASPILTPDQATVGLQEQTTGITLGPGVRVSGFGYGGTILDRGILSGVTPETCQLHVWGYSNAEVHWGTPWFVQSGPGGYGTAQILLSHMYYTQAMKDAGDYVFQVVGGFAMAYDIVGLYSTGVKA